MQEGFYSPLGGGCKRVSIFTIVGGCRRDSTHLKGWVQEGFYLPIGGGCRRVPNLTYTITFSLLPLCIIPFASSSSSLSFSRLKGEWEISRKIETNSESNGS